MQVKNMLAGGCSFTAHGIGGKPPSEGFAGGNSYRDYPGTEFKAAEPYSWTDHLGQRLSVDSYVNVATFACGNTLTSAAIRTILEKYNYAPTDTLVMFNVTSMSRLDFKVKYNNSNDFIPWKEDLLDFTFLKPHSSAWLGALKEADISVEEIVKRNTHEMHLLFEYLTENAYPFVFTTMEDYSHLPLIQKYKDNLVPLPGNGMFEYARSVDMLIEHDYFHPSGEGQVQMAKLTHDFIKKKYNIDG